MRPPDSPPGLLSSLRTLGDDLLASLQDRVELVSLELQEEKCRLIQTFIWISAVLFAAGMALTFASLTLVYLCWEKARLGVLAGLMLLGGVVLCGLKSKNRCGFCLSPDTWDSIKQAKFSLQTMPPSSRGVCNIRAKPFPYADTAATPMVSGGLAVIS